MYRIVLCLFAAAVARAADPDPAPLLRKSVDAFSKNGQKAAQYAFREYHEQRNFDKNGKPTGHSTETWDIIGLEGSTYRKLTMRDDKPLSAKEQKREDERLIHETERRKSENADQRKKRLFSYNVNVSYSKVADISNLRFLREDTLEGRRVWLVQADPRRDYQPVNDSEKETMKYRFVFWIDQEDYFPTRIEQEMIGDGSRMQKGSTITWDFTRLPEGAWLPKTCTIHYQLKMMKMFTARGESLQTFSDFHRFAVDSKIVEESK